MLNHQAFFFKTETFHDKANTFLHRNYQLFKLNAVVNAKQERYGQHLFPMVELVR